mgnify:CR=1 FL=1
MGENILNKRFSSIMQNAMDKLQEGEAGDHDRMYKVVHVKKGMMDIKAKTSYEAAKKFAKEKGLKSTAGVDTHLYPLEDMTFEGYKIMPPMDKEKYPEMPGLEGPFTMMSGKVVYYDPKEGAYYDKDTDMYMSYDEFQQHDNDYSNMKDERDEVKKEADELNIGAKGDRPYKGPPRQPKRGDPINVKSKGVDPKVLNMFLTNGVSENVAVRRDGKTLSKSEVAKLQRQGVLMKDDVGVESVATEGDGRKKGIHPKGHPMRQKQQAAIHANSVDLNSMRDALKLDESVDTNTVVAEYTRATLDHRHNTWGKVCEQIDFIRSLVKEDVDVNNVRLQIRKMHEQEGLDNKILIKDDVDKLRQIVRDKSAMSIKFADGSMKVDMTTASIFLQVFDKVKEETQAKIVDRIQTKQGFLSVLDKMYSMIG